MLRIRFAEKARAQRDPPPGDLQPRFKRANNKYSLPAAATGV
jgi:hypothetical protein